MARSFGATDKVVSAAFAPSASKSHCFWVKAPNVGDTTSRGLFAHGFSPYCSVNASEFGGGTPTAGSIYWSHSYGSDRRVQVINPGITWANWNHLAFTFDATTGAVVVYVNGVSKTLDLNVASSGSEDLTSAAVTAGNRSSGTSGFTGQMAYFSAHNVVLTSTEVNEHMNTGHTTRGRVLAWDLGAGSPEPDQSGNGRTGTVTGTTVVADPSLATTFTQAITAASTATASVVRKIAINRPTSSAGTASMSRRAAIVRSAASTGTPSLIKRAGKSFSASAAGMAVLTAQRVALLALTATATVAATMGKRVVHSFAASAAGTAVMVKRAATSLSIGSAATITLSTLRVVLVGLTTASTATVSMSRRAVKSIVATTTGAPSIVKRVGKPLAAASSAAVSLVKRPARVLVVATMGTTSMARWIGKAITALVMGSPAITTLGGTAAAYERGIRAEAMSATERASVSSAAPSPGTRRVP